MNLEAVKPALFVELVELERDVREMYTNFVAVKRLEYKYERVEACPGLVLFLHTLFLTLHFALFLRRLRTKKIVLRNST